MGGGSRAVESEPEPLGELRPQPSPRRLDQPPVGPAEGEFAVGISLYSPSAPMDEPVVEPAQGDQIVGIGEPAVGPMDEVVGVRPPGTAAAGEPAATVAPSNAPHPATPEACAGPGRSRPCRRRPRPPTRPDRRMPTAGPRRCRPALHQQSHRRHRRPGFRPWCARRPKAVLRRRPGPGWPAPRGRQRTATRMDRARRSQDSPASCRPDVARRLPPVQAPPLVGALKAAPSPDAGRGGRSPTAPAPPGLACAGPPPATEPSTSRAPSPPTPRRSRPWPRWSPPPPGPNTGHRCAPP